VYRGDFVYQRQVDQRMPLTVFVDPGALPTCLSRTLDRFLTPLEHPDDSSAYRYYSLGKMQAALSAPIGMVAGTHTSS
jgi:hypothetical protein